MEESLRLSIRKLRGGRLKLASASREEFPGRRNKNAGHSSMAAMRSSCFLFPFSRMGQESLNKVEKPEPVRFFQTRFQIVTSRVAFFSNAGKKNPIKPMGQRVWDAFSKKYETFTLAAKSNGGAPHGRLAGAVAGPPHIRRGDCIKGHHRGVVETSSRSGIGEHFFCLKSK